MYASVSCDVGFLKVFVFLAIPSPFLIRLSKLWEQFGILIWPTSACVDRFRLLSPASRRHADPAGDLQMYVLAKSTGTLHMSMIVLVRDCSVRFSFDFRMLLCLKFLRLVCDFPGIPPASLVCDFPWVSY